MKKVMVRAWEIARAAVVKFGGKVKEFFAEALKMAWAEVKEDKIEKVITINTKNAKLNETVARFAEDMNNRIVKAVKAGKDLAELNRITRHMNSVLTNNCTSVLEALIGKNTIQIFKELTHNN